MALLPQGSRPRFLNKIRKLELRFDLAKQHFEHVRRHVLLSSTCASLQSLSYNIAGVPIVSRFRVFVRRYGVRAPYALWTIGMLGETRKAFAATDVEIKLELELGLEGMDARMKPGLERYPGRWENVLREMYHALDGEVWVDGILCYKDGRAILSP